MTIEPDLREVSWACRKASRWAEWFRLGRRPCDAGGRREFSRAAPPGGRRAEPGGGQPPAVLVVAHGACSARCARRWGSTEHPDAERRADVVRTAGGRRDGVEAGLRRLSWRPKICYRPAAAGQSGCPQWVGNGRRATGMDRNSLASCRPERQPLGRHGYLSYMGLCDIHPSDPWPI